MGLSSISRMFFIRDSKGDSGSHVQFASQDDGASHQLQILADDEKPGAGAGHRAHVAGPGKPLEQVRLVFFGNAHALVLHAPAELLAVAGATHNHGRVLIGVFEGVGRQVQQYFAQQRRVEANLGGRSASASRWFDRV